MRKFGLFAALLTLCGATLAQVSSFPDNNPSSGRYTNVTRGLSSLGDTGVRFKIVATGKTFRLGIFDGNGTGRWDVACLDITRYTLYADPTSTGATSIQIGQWTGDTMPDNAWWYAYLENTTSAQVGQSFIYNLVVDWSTTNYTREQNNFKVGVVGGRVSIPANTTFEVIGYMPNDPMPALFSPSTYDQTWTFQLGEVTEGLTIWDGDFDVAVDNNDPSITGIPSWNTSPNAYNEGVWAGAPADANISYSVTTGGVTYSKSNPSGNREWEILTIPSAVGTSTLTIQGADGRNTLFLHATAEIFGVETPMPSTRSAGFWRTHPGALDLALTLGVDLGMVGDQDCTLLDIGTAEAIFWTHTSGHSCLGKARIKLASQLIAAICNVKAFGAAPLFDLNETVASLDGTDIAEMNCWTVTLESFNTSNEGTIPSAYNMSADPKGARALANTLNGVIYPGDGFL